ncbi:8-amino-7-oxononanoate synthase [Klebsiella pneumoniae]|uniref:8-amino-7-oxononanoate synthase n=1 Tax=Klebsiella pneumoniae TaxID=573 RepID=A0A3S4GT90_KLEPN|nr:8-amino-7-oxononanoate synthase [Klebsiella pneumoniae]
MSWQQRIDRALDERRAAEAFRRRLPVTHGAGRWLEREGERWLNFSSNDYLGLSQHPAIIAAWQQGATRYGVGAGGSGHVSGYSESPPRAGRGARRLAGLSARIAVYLRLCRESGADRRPWWRKTIGLSPTV